jgi:hypothetical protein
MKPYCNLYDNTATNHPTAGDGFDIRTFWRILRIEGLIPFTGCAILIGFAVNLWEAGFSGAEWRLFVIAVIAGMNTVYGAGIDQLCTHALYSVFPDFALKANKLMLQQVGATMIHGLAITVILLTFWVES